MLSRRALLQRLAWLGMSATLLRTREVGAGASAWLRAPSDPVAGLLRHGTSAAVVGTEYLRIRPEEADAEMLRRRCGLPDAPSDKFGSAALMRLAEKLLDQHRDDFRAGRVIELGGFTLSVTELRLCAIVSLAG